MGLSGTTASNNNDQNGNTANRHPTPMPTISAKVSPAQIQVLHSTATGSHPTLAPHQYTSHTLEAASGDNNNSSGGGGGGPPVNLPLHTSQLRFTENIVTLPPAFGNLLSNLVKPGAATVSASETASNMDQQQQNTATENSKVRMALFCWFVFSV